ncbi:hypothetical protein KR009_000448, partial [Drosophila setifemur]
IEKKTLKHALSLCAFHFVSMAMSMAMSLSMCAWRWRCARAHVCGCARIRNMGGSWVCVVCYQLRFMQICLAAEPSPAVDFFVNSFSSTIRPFV